MHPIDIPLQAAGLWLRGAELGVRAAILPVQLSARAASAVLDHVPTRERPAPADAPRPVPVGRPITPAPAPAKAETPTAPKADAPTRTKARAKAPSRREIHPEPAAGHAEVHVAEPWEGYAALSAAEVVDRLADADETVRAAVRLYEGANGSREAVLHATEG